MTDFEKFLKEKRKWGGYAKPVKVLDFVIPVRDLGEWAWEKARFESINCEDIGAGTRHAIYYEIAIACLGKKTIVKRLKEMEKWTAGNG